MDVVCEKRDIIKEMSTLASQEERRFSLLEQELHDEMRCCFSYSKFTLLKCMNMTKLNLLEILMRLILKSLMLIIKEMGTLASQ
jgi:hypothetical protein